MQMTAYYNEYNPEAAAWLRELIDMGLIAPGVVDDRSIIDVQANDLDGFTQCHFFAGIGGWSAALRLAGITDDHPLWTASLPCQPFSSAGKQLGKSDERHLLPHFIKLVRQRRPNIIFGEQVPGAVKHGWLDDLYTEMDAENYATGSIILTAAGASAYHIRQRIYWGAVDRLADTKSQRNLRKTGKLSGKAERQESGHLHKHIGTSGISCWMADRIDTGSQGRLRGRTDSQRKTVYRYAGRSGAIGGMGNTEHKGHDNPAFGRETGGSENQGRVCKPERPNPVSFSIWDNPDWVYCRDGKYRPIEPGTRPTIPTARPTKSTPERVADGLPGGVGNSGDTGAPEIETDYYNTQEARKMRLVGYGNAIAPQVAAGFIMDFMEAINDTSRQTGA